MSKSQLTPRDDKGRFLVWMCDDLNCCGTLMLDGGGWDSPGWRCDGLTHDGKGGPLVACARWYPAPSDALVPLQHQSGDK